MKEILALTTSLMWQNGDSKCHNIECCSCIKDWASFELKSLVSQKCVVQTSVVFTRLDYTTYRDEPTNIFTHCLDALYLQNT